MLTTDLALRFDPAYEKISRRFLEHPDAVRRRLRPRLVQAHPPRHGPARALPRPGGAGRGAPLAGPASRRSITRSIDAKDIAALKAQDPRLGALGRAARRRPPGPRPRPSAAPTSAAAPTARASASRRRRTGRSTSPRELAKVLETLEGIQREFNGAQAGGKKVSLADLIVLGGCAAVEQAAKNAGHDVTVPFTPGRTDASQEQTDVESFAVLEPIADGFRNYLKAQGPAPGRGAAGRQGAAADADRAGDDGARRRPARAGRQRRRTPSTASSPTRPEALTNDFFVNLLDMGTEWKPSSDAEDVFEGRDRKTGDGQVDRHPRRPRLRLELAAPRPRRGLRAARTRRRSSCATSSRRGTR